MSFRDSAPAFVKRWVWDRKFRHSAVVRSWVAPPDFVSSVYACAGSGGSVLDLGCGTASLFTELVRLGWAGKYVGVDVSRAAIEIARQHANACAEWAVSTIEDYTFSGKFDAICFLESIYYVRPSKISELIAKCVEHLTPRGRIFVRVWDRSRHAESIRQIESLHCGRLLLFVTG